MEKDIIWLSDTLEDVNLVGGKASNLMKMMKLGFPVPDGFVIRQERINDGIKDEIVKNFEKLLKSYPSVSVRSSANVEDSKDASFAGIFGTTLYVNGKETLFDSIKKSFESVRSPHVEFYSKKKGIDPSKIKMNVIVQGMVDADKSGVIFTKDIRNNDGKSVLIEVSEGIGENVVDGIRIPSRFVVEKKTKEIVEEIVNEISLNKKELSDLVEYAKILEEYYGHPQDIEWAIKDKQVFLLQIRPITS